MKALIQYLPDKKLPEEFTDYVSTMQHLTPPDKVWAKKALGAFMTDEEKKTMLFWFQSLGCLPQSKRPSECNTVCDTIMIIFLILNALLAYQVNCKMNPLWNQFDLDKSGTNLSGVFRAIREAFWKQTLGPKYRTKVKNAIAYKKKSSNVRPHSRDV